MPTQIDQLEIEIVSSSGQAASQIDRLSSSLQNLKNSAKITTALNNLNKLTSALNGLSATSGASAKMTQLTSALSNLNALDGKGIKNIANSLSKLPTIINKLDSKTIQEFSTKMNQLNKALAPIANNLDKVGNAFSRLPANVKKASSAVSTMQTSTRGSKGGGFFSSFAGKFAIVSAALYKIGDALGSAISKTNDYVETLNLFQTSMGEFYDEAYAYAELVQDKLGIDSTQWMEAQGTFMSMANGFGVANDKAYELSKGLTELSYDISSFRNLPIEEAFAKVRSGLAGELEPLRALGFALSEASLQELAYRKGIDQSVSSMTEAQKALLRYTAMVEQAADMGMIGDLAKTLESTANALRILKQQFEQLARAIGSVFIPILIKVIPYVQAVTKVLTDLIRGLASLVGFELPDWSSQSSGMTSNIGSTTDALDDATAAAKKFKSVTMGFDELNIISPQTDTSTGAEEIGLGGDLPLDIQSIWDEAQIAQINTQVDELTGKIEAFGSTLYDMFLKPLEGINFQPLIDSLSRLWEALKPFAGAIGQGLYWFYLNVLVPLAYWTIEDALPTFLNGLAAALEFVTPYLYDFGDWIAENKQNIADLIPVIGAFAAAFVALKGIGLGKVVEFFSLVSADGLLATLSGMGGNIGASLTGAFSTLSTVIAPVTAAVVALGSVFLVLYENWNSVVAVIQDFIDKIGLDEKFNAITTALSPLFEKLSGLQNLFRVIGTVILTALQPAFAFLAGIFNAVITAAAPLINALMGILDVLGGIGDFIVNVFTGQWDELGSNITQIAEGIGTTFSSLKETIAVFFAGFLEGFIEWFGSLWDAFEQWRIDTWNGITSFFTDLINGIVGWLGDIVNNVVSWFAELGTNIWNSLSDIYENNIKPWFSIEKWAELGKNAIDGLLNGLKNIGNGIAEWGNNFLNGVMDFLGIHSPSTEMEAIGSNLMPGLYNGIMATQSVVMEAINTVVQRIKNAFNTGFEIDGEQSLFFLRTGKSMMNSLINAFNQLMPKLNNVLESLVDLVSKMMGAAANEASSAARSIISSVNSAIAALERLENAEASSGGSTSSEYSLGGRSARTMNIPVQVFASGGFIEDGLFTMNQGEIAGKFLNTGRSVVANNDQITAGISQAVYDAIRNANFDNNNDNLTEQRPIQLEVYLDGKQIYADVKRRDKEQGANIYSGGVLNVY